MRKSAMMMCLVAGLILALTAATVMAAPNKSKGSAGKGKNSKVVLCHKGKTITVASSAVKGHSKHGDTPGACPAGTTTAPPATTVVAPEPTMVTDPAPQPSEPAPETTASL